MIHRAPFGSMERFVAVLIEHTAGKFPLWLTPDQAVILPISEKVQRLRPRNRQITRRAGYPRYCGRPQRKNRP